jgi:SAM-dependent methyltransferase
MENIAASTTLPRLGAFPRARLWQRRQVEIAKKRVRETVRPGARRHFAVRRRLAKQHLAGAGLEIGALHIPLQVPRSVTVRYVDRFGIDQLRASYSKYDPMFQVYPIVTPDVIDDGETLATVADGSVDFVIANHMIEHCEDPIGTLKTFLRVLRPGGAIYMAVPDCRLTFDRDRPVTPVSHVLADHREGPERSRREHFEEYARLVDKVAPGEVSAWADQLQRDQYTIHYHVWTPADFVELIAACRSELGLPIELDALERNNHEFIVILRRAAE